MRFINLIGQQFGKLVVIRKTDNKIFPSGQTKIQYVCKCECGNECVVLACNLSNGNTRSCGCYKLEHQTNHNLWGSKIYKTWDNMRNRCLNPNATGFKNWGGRGITIFDEWKNDFKAFYNYVSQLPHFGEAGRSLDRINNDGNYEPGNLRWATKYEQNHNRRK